MTVPSDWHIEVRAKGGAALTPVVVLASPSFTAPAVEKLVDVGAFSFTLGQWDAQAPACDPKLGREIRLYRGASWAAATWKQAYVITSRRVTTDRRAVFGCESLAVYFRERFIDRGSQRQNLLLNGDFEDLSGGIPHWAATATTATLIATDHVDGSHSVKLVQAADNADAFLRQDVTYSAVDTLGDELTLAAWVKINAWTGPALSNFGIVVRVLDGLGNPVDLISQPDGFSSFDIDYRTARGEWLKGETIAFVPFAGGPYTLQAKIFSINGELLVDAVFLGQFESLSYLQTEQHDIAVGIVVFLQDTSKGKDNLNITTAGPATGIKRDRTWQYADHVNGLQALKELAGLDDGIEWIVTADRVFTTAAISGGGLGTDKTGSVTLTVGTNCEIVSHAFDRPSGASDVTTLGDGSGPGREEGGANDSSLFGGAIVQQVLSAPSVDTLVDSLVPWAQRELGLFGDPTTMELVVTDRELGFTLAMGDRVTIFADQGCVQENGHARIVGTAADPKADLMTVTVNRVP